MKKGFTLIELLAVILILGIIALIAIPTVSKIIDEARFGAFKAGSDNIMKSIEEKCQSDLIKGITPTLTYIFTDGKSNHKIEVKGILPSDGYILLDNDCSVVNYYLKDKNQVYSNGDDITASYMLMNKQENKSIFETLYPTYYSNIQKISFIDNLTYHDGAIEIKNVSISGGDEIQSWLVPNGEKYDLYIGSLGKIYANYDSSYLFYNASAENIYFNNFNTSFVKKMNNMFRDSLNLKYMDVSRWDTSNVTDMGSVFNNCQSLISTGSLANWNTSNVLSFATMFWSCYNLLEIDVSRWDTSNVTNMADVFSSCTKLQKLDLSNWDTSNVNMMQYLFCNCDSLTELDLSSFNFSNVTSILGFFYDCNNLKKINLSSFSVEKMNNTAYVFHQCDKLETITINASSSIINTVIQLLPDRTSLTTGNIITKVDKSTLEITTAETKNWQII